MRLSATAYPVQQAVPFVESAEIAEILPLSPPPSLATPPTPPASLRPAAAAAAAAALPALAVTALRSPSACGRLLMRITHVGSDLLMRYMRRLGFEERWVDTCCGKLHAVEAPGKGTLPPLVLMPGLCAEAADYCLLIPKLLPHFSRVVVLETPGHGRSALPDPCDADSLAEALREALHTLVPEPFVLLGHSAGGQNAMHYAAHHGHRLHALLLVAPSGAPYTDAQEAFYKQLLTPSGWRDAHALARATWGRGWRALLLAAPTLVRFTSRAIQRLLCSDWLRRWVRPEELTAIPCRTLLLWSGQDALLPPEGLTYLTQHLPAHAVARREPALSHASFVDGRGPEVGILLDFLRAEGAPERPTAPRLPALPPLPPPGTME